MSKIYTKTGDKGETGFFGGERVKKSHPRIRAYGAVDELNAALGQVRALGEEKGLDPVLNRIQNDLFDIGAILATPKRERLEGRTKTSLGAGDISFLEETIDRYDRELPSLRSFILPGGDPLAAAFHLARTICRRAEREIVELHEKDPVDSEILIYVNRLSDLLFVLGRWANFKKGVPEAPWSKKGEGGDER